MLRSTAAVWTLALVAATLVGVGCASHQNQMNAPVTPDQVQFYTKKPADYDKVGMIELPVTPDVRWDDRGDSPKGIQMLKEKAAAMGANGILTDLDPSQFNITALVGDGKGGWFQVPVRTTGGTRTAVGQAIRVK